MPHVTASLKASQSYFGAREALPRLVSLEQTSQIEEGIAIVNKNPQGLRLEHCGEEESQIVRRMHERPGGCGTRSHTDPAIGETCRDKRYPVRQVGRLVKKCK